MKPQTMLVALLAIVFGGSAALGVKQYLRANPSARADTVPVVVAALPIERGTLVGGDLVTTRDYPRSLVPTGAVVKPEDALDRSALLTFSKDEPLIETKLSPKGQRGLAAQIPKGMRAFTINTPNVASGVAGFVLPGNRVDVLLTVTTGGTVTFPSSMPLYSAVSNNSNFGSGDRDPTGGGTTTTLLQNIEILAVDQRIEAPAENKVDTKNLQSVTLLVTPDQAAKLDLGQSKGTLHLTLRNPTDSDPATTKPATVADLRLYQEPPFDQKARGFLLALGAMLEKARPKAEPPKPEVKPEPPRRFIRAVRGGSESMIQIIEPAVVAPGHSR